MMELYRGLIIDLDLEPTIGSETGKTRPCIIVTNNTYNQRVPVIQVVPLTEWSLKKSQIKTNIAVEASAANGLSKRSIADCLQTRPVDYQRRLVSIRGELELEILEKINHALKIVFDIL
jgi:mRNA interferase MazF